MATKKTKDKDAPKATTTALAKVDNFVSPEEASAQTQGGGGYEFLKLVQPQTRAKDEVEGLNDGDFLLGRDTNLGDEVANVVPMANRSRAVLFNRDEGTVEMESFDSGSKEYSEIRSRKGDYGLEFLFWFPEHGKFGAFHFGKASSRSLGAEAVKAAQSKNVITLKSKMVTNKKGRFAVAILSHGPTDEKLASPTKAAYEAAIAAFNSVKLERSAEQTGREH